MALAQYILILALPFLEVISLFLKEKTQIIDISSFIHHIGMIFNGALCATLMRFEFPRIMRPGVYSLSMRLYFLLLFLLTLAYYIVPFIIIPESSHNISLILACSFRIVLILAINSMSLFSLWKSKDLHMQPLLYEDSGNSMQVGEHLEKAKNDEESDEFRLTRSTSILSSPPDLSNVKGEYMESRGFFNNRNKNFSIDIPKVLISHDSNSEIIVLYEIKVFDIKGKVFRTIYRRFSEFETLHNEVVFNEVIRYFKTFFKVEGGN